MGNLQQHVKLWGMQKTTSGSIPASREQESESRHRLIKTEELMIGKRLGDVFLILNCAFFVSISKCVSLRLWIEMGL